MIVPRTDWCRESDKISSNEIDEYEKRIDDTNKIGHAVIDIFIQSVGSRFMVQYLTGTLYHEFNHLYHLWMCACHNSIDYKRDVAVVNNHYFIKPDQHVDELLYSLISDTEINANVASVYGEMKEMNSKKQNWKEDLHRTSAYQRYIINKCNIDWLERNFADGDIRILSEWIEMNFHLRMKSDKENFIKMLRKKNEDFLLHLGRAASLYYDDIDTNPKTLDEMMMLYSPDDKHVLSVDFIDKYKKL